jgi:hypothetical protein
VSFVVSAPTVVGRELVLRGELRNDGADEALVWLFDAPTGGGPFQVELAGPGVSWKPVPVDGPGQPEVYPMARVVHVPPAHRAPVRGRPCTWRSSRGPKGAAATVSWSFQTMPAPREGHRRGHAAVSVTRPAICPLCEASCGLLVEVDGDVATGVRGDPADPLSRGHLCPKATALLDLHADPDRLRHPIKRTAKGWERVSWDEALDDIAARLHALQVAHGKDTIGVYLGNPNVHNLGQMTFAPQFWRTLGTKSRFSATSVDQLPHHVAASLMFGHQLLLPVPDVDHTDLLVLVGHDPLVSNGSLWTVPDVRKRLDALRERGGRLVVVDPRRSATAKRADRHLSIRPRHRRRLPVRAAAPRARAGGRARRAGAPTPTASTRSGRGWLASSPSAWPAFCGVAPGDLVALADSLRATPRAVVHARMGASTQLFGGSRTVGGQRPQRGVQPPRHGRRRHVLRARVRPAAPARGPAAWGRGRSRSTTRACTGGPSFGGEWPVAELADEILTPGEGQLRGMLVWAGEPGVVHAGRPARRAGAALARAAGVRGLLRQRDRGPRALRAAAGRPARAPRTTT